MEVSREAPAESEEEGGDALDALLLDSHQVDPLTGAVTYQPAFSHAYAAPAR